MNKVKLNLPLYVSKDVYHALQKTALSWDLPIHEYVDKDLRRILSLPEVEGAVPLVLAREDATRSADREESFKLARTRRTCPSCLRQMTIDSRGRWPRHKVHPASRATRSQFPLCPKSLHYVVALSR